MKGVLCKRGETEPSQATMTLHRGETVVVIKGVPADVCMQCGEHYMDDSITARVLAIAEEAVQHGAGVEILRYAA